MELGDVIESKETRNPRTDGSKSFRYIDVQTVDNSRNRVNVAQELASRTAPSRARRLVRKDDVLFCLVRPYLRNIARVPPELDGQVASTAFCVLRPSGAMASRFLFHQVLRDSFIGEIPTYGTSPPSAREDEFLKQRIPLAPLPEQHRIVAKIESLFARLDEGVAALKRAEANLERYRASVLKAAVEGRLTEEWRKENPPEETGEDLLRRILAKRRTRWEAEQLAKFEAKGRKPPKNWRAKYKEPVAPDTSGLPGLPEGWCWATVDMLIREPLRNGKSAKASKDGTGVRTLTLSAVTEGDFSEHNTKVTIADLDTVRDLWLEPEDILVERANTPELVGLACMYRGPEGYAVFPDLLIRVRCIRRVAAAFVELSLQSPDARSYLRKRARGSAGSLPKISQGMLAELTLPVPPRSEQDEILRRFGSLVTTAAELLSGKVTMAARRVATLRQSILKRAFEGRLVPQNPADEPASVLMERIRAERAAERKRRKHRPAKPRSRQRSRVR